MKFDDFNGILKKKRLNPIKTFKKPIPDQKFLTTKQFRNMAKHTRQKNHPTLAKTIFQNVCKKRRTLARSRFQPPKFQPHLFILLLSLEKRPKVRDPKWQKGRQTEEARNAGYFTRFCYFAIFCCCPSQIELIFVQIQLFKTVRFVLFCDARFVLSIGKERE